VAEREAGKTSEERTLGESRASETLKGVGVGGDLGGEGPGLQRLVLFLLLPSPCSALS
jgi:hypothetical protein